MKAILYIAHGTRSPKGAEEARAFVRRVMSRIDDVPVQELSFLELTEPLIEDGFKLCAEKGATEITALPLFLLAAGHIKRDIPRILSLLQSRYPSTRAALQDPFGVQGKIVDAMAELIRAAAGRLTPQEELLIVGRGSSDPGICTDFSAIARGIGERLGLEQERVSVCYLAAAEPKLDEALRDVTKRAGGKIVVFPYLLFSGLLYDEIYGKLQKLQKHGLELVLTAPLSRHRLIEDIVVNRALGTVKVP